MLIVELYSRSIRALKASATITLVVSAVIAARSRTHVYTGERKSDLHNLDTEAVRTIQKPSPREKQLDKNQVPSKR